MIDSSGSKIRAEVNSQDLSRKQGLISGEETLATNINTESNKCKSPPHISTRSKPSSKRTAGTEEVKFEWFSHPAVEKVLSEQIRHVEADGDFLDLSENPIFKVSPKRQKTEQGFWQKIESTYWEAVKTVGNKTVVRDSPTYVHYNNSFDPRLYFQGMLPYNCSTNLSDSRLPQITPRNHLLHLSNSSDLMEKHMARYRVYVLGLAHTSTTTSKMGQQVLDKTPIFLDHLPEKDTTDHFPVDMSEYDLQTLGSMDNIYSDNVRLLWVIPLKDQDLKKSSCNHSHVPKVPVTRPLPVPWGRQDPFHKDWQETAEFPDKEPQTLAQIAMKTLTSSAMNQTVYSPPGGEKEQDCDSIKHCQTGTTGHTDDNLMSPQVNEPDTLGSTQLITPHLVQHKTRQRKLWDDNDLPLSATAKGLDEPQFSPRNFVFKRSLSDPDLHWTHDGFQPEKPSSALEIGHKPESVEELPDKPKTEKSICGLNPLSSEFFPSIHSPENLLIPLTIPNTSAASEGDKPKGMPHHSEPLGPEPGPNVGLYHKTYTTAPRTNTAALNLDQSGRQSKGEVWNRLPARSDAQNTNVKNADITSQPPVQAKPLWVNGPGSNAYLEDGINKRQEKVKYPNPSIPPLLTQPTYAQIANPDASHVQGNKSSGITDKPTLLKNDKLYKRNLFQKGTKPPEEYLQPTLGKYGQKHTTWDNTAAVKPTTRSGHGAWKVAPTSASTMFGGESYIDTTGRSASIIPLSHHTNQGSVETGNINCSWANVGFTSATHQHWDMLPGIKQAAFGPLHSFPGNINAHMPVPQLGPMSHGQYIQGFPLIGNGVNKGNYNTPLMTLNSMPPQRHILPYLSIEQQHLGRLQAHGNIPSSTQNAWFLHGMMNQNHPMMQSQPIERTALNVNALPFKSNVKPLDGFVRQLGPAGYRVPAGAGQLPPSQLPPGLQGAQAVQGNSLCHHQPPPMSHGPHSIEPRPDLAPHNLHGPPNEPLHLPTKKIEVNQLMQEILAASSSGQKLPQRLPNPAGNTNSNCSAGEQTEFTDDPWQQLADLQQKFTATQVQ